MNLLAAIFGAYLLFVGGVFAMQRTLLYPATRQAPDPLLAQSAGIEILTMPTADGLRLSHWYRPPADPAGLVVVVFHGNGGHVGHRVAKFAPLMRAGFGVLLAGYRGYGGNPGRPSEEDLTADARALLPWLAERGVAPERVVLYGESLGAGLAVKLAAEQPVAAMVLESPYTSIADLAQMHYWYLPARWLILDEWNVAGEIGRSKAPLLVLHGGRDRTIPPRFGRRLFDAAPEPKEYILVERAGHNDVLDFSGVTERIIDFLQKRLPLAETVPPRLSKAGR